MAESKFTTYAMRQNFLETCRVRSTHHRELKMNGSLLQITPLWDAFAQTSYCAQRTLQSPLQKVSCTNTNIDTLSGGSYE
jgi:hypothetical protein